MTAIETVQFAGKERDAQTGLDYFGARYFSGAQGRFTSPDPLYIEMNRLTDPQQLNLYAYARNNSLKFGDPLGLDIACTGDRCDDYLKGFRKAFHLQLHTRMARSSLPGRSTRRS
jgi:RHS repeat-associated protein